MNSKSVKSNFTNPNVNPCLEETNLTNNCIERNNYDYSLCQQYFDNYNLCKKFWGSVYSARKRAGIKPFMPPEEERKHIIREKEKGNTVISF